jgi:exodeoxyribonuclease VII large subunit
MATRRGTAPADSGPHVFTVSELNRTVRDLLEGGLGAVWIEGELSNIARPASGHLYFSLKDRDAQVRCAMFRGRNRLMDFRPDAGMQVRARARVSLYEARGDYQLIVEQMEPAGAGALARAFEELKKRLDAEGLFAQDRKRALPRMPRRIGIITSPSGAAVRDVLKVLARRFPAIPVVIYPVQVQGERAATAIARMIETAGRRADCDVLLLVRGGGSLEDLWPFNEEAVARAVVASAIPVVSGVGHEVDVTIADFAADVRAPTPSAAAELVVPDAGELLQTLDRLRRRLEAAARAFLRRREERRRNVESRLRRQHPERRLQQLQQRRDELELRLRRIVRHAITARRDRLDRIEARLRRASPITRIERLRERMVHARRRLDAAVRADLNRRDARLAALSRALEAVSPLATLGRGYALVRTAEDGRAVTDAREVQPGQHLDIHLARGRLEADVTHSEPGTGEGDRTTTNSPGANWRASHEVARRKDAPSNEHE